MVQATQFLLRWLYLNSLIHERVEIQSIPQIHPHWHPQPTYDYNVPHKAAPENDYNSNATASSMSDMMIYSQHQQRQLHQLNSEIEWRQKALHAIALYPPGALRLLALDSLRLEVVHELARELHEADKIVQEFVTRGRKEEHRWKRKELQDDYNKKENQEDIHLTRDLEREMNVQMSRELHHPTHNGGKKSITTSTTRTGYSKRSSHSKIESDLDSSDDEQSGEYDEFLSMTPSSYEKTSRTDSSSSLLSSTSLEPKVRAALALQRETREFMPQIISAILHSPAPLTQSTMYTPHLNPLEALQHLLITRCIRDPNLGIEVCWLLEAEVGRAWKRLFEHRAQTGRRLIIILDADKAAVLSQIGSGKKQAFDLLQEVECATAYGAYGDDYHQDALEDQTATEISASSNGDAFILQSKPNNSKNEYYSTPKLPASLSQKRCRHFGDTMTFLDRLTQISLDLRMVPLSQRHDFLINSLEEMNRRLRRRMITKGMISLDVEDNLGPYDWPSITDLPLENIQYSIHLPLEPTATVWPKGAAEPNLHTNMHTSPLLELKTEHGVMRVVNIVSNKARVLASRERCPYLVHCEVVETGLEGRDARLYASNGSGFGCTIQEALGIAARTKQIEHTDHKSFATYMIPPELSQSTMLRVQTQAWSPIHNIQLRGGNQGDYYSNHNDGYNPYDLIREEELRQLHEQLQSNMHHPHYSPSPHTSTTLQNPYTPNTPPHYPLLSTYSNLLDRVYGSPWSDTCEKIRQMSPYGKVKGWRLASFILKAGEDIRREALVMQVISKMKIWFDADIPLENRPFLKPYTIMCVGGDAGLLECLRDAKSVDEVKKSTDGFTTLREYFERAYGPPTNRKAVRASPTDSTHSTTPYMLSFEKAQDNFLRSLVGYSLVCYILQIKDRHNANILLDREGHIMHIDFGFVLGDTPKMGKVPLFSERAPFKLTSEFWEVIGGWNFTEGGLGVKFCKMFEEAFACASAHSEELVSLIEAALMNLTRNAHEAKMLSKDVKYRLRMRGPRGSVQQKMFIMDLVNTALTSWGTSTYDWLQKSMNGYI